METVSILVAVGLFIVGIIIGMVVELLAMSKLMHDMQKENKDLRSHLANSRRAEVTEVIEIITDDSSISPEETLDFSQQW